jgi:ubiquinone/menaquinone biosynthesis C-methylase UbiE
MTDLLSFDRVAHLYDVTRAMPPEAEMQIGDALAALMHEVAPHPWALEVGIGTGRIAVPLVERGVRMAGVDISTKMLAILRDKRADIDVMIAEASQPPLRERSFDAALFVHILHLVPDAEATLRAIIPLVKPGGVIIEGGDLGHEGPRAQADVLVRTTVAELASIDLENHAVRKIGPTFEGLAREYGLGLEYRTIAGWTSRTPAAFGRFPTRSCRNYWRQ